MACRQFFPCRLGNGNVADRFIGVAGDGYSWLSSAPTSGGTLVRWTGTWMNFIFQHVSAPGSGKTWTYTLVKNGVDTAVVITIADLATEGRSTAQVSVSSGDQCYWRRSSTGSPTLSHVRYCAEFSHAADNLNGYHGHDTLNTGSGLSAPLFCPSTWSATVASANNSVVAAPGTLTEVYCKLGVAPGSGKSYAFATYVDGVIQDGAGGTTDTRFTIADSATTGSWSGSIALTAGKYVTVSATPSGTPAATDVSVAVTFAPTTDGESNLCGHAFFNMATSGTTYLTPAQSDDAFSYDATESNVDVIGGIGDFVLRDLYIHISNTIGTGPITLNTRQNGASVGPTVTLTSGQTGGSDLTNEVTISDGDTWSLQDVVTGSPGIARQMSQAWVLYALSATPTKRVYIFGQGGSVSSTPTFLANLDGVTRTVALPNSHAIGGNLALIEQAAAPTGTANTAKLYAIDDGAGKTRLMVIFGSGAAIELAVEP